VDVCPRGVFDIEDGLAVVGNANKCSMCRQCAIDPRFGPKYVELGRVKDSFCFSIESVGAIPAEEIFKRAVLVLKDKCEVIKKTLQPPPATDL
jgi:DNA-directed RNA polymerase I and III subunit RPAC1